jgi:chromosomal replication initiator protein
MLAWQKFLETQETELGVDTVNQWLRSLKILRFDACNLFLEAKDTFQALWFEEHIRQKTQTKLLNNNNKRIKVHLSIANAPPKTRTKFKTATTSATNPKFILSFDEINPFCTFDYFISGVENDLPYKLFLGLGGGAEGIPPTELGVFNPIYLHGSTGTGKTHLLMAIANVLREKGKKVIYVRADTFTEHVVRAIRAGEMSIFRQAYRNIDVLLIDDVHVFSKKGATQEEFFHTFNTLHLTGKQIILSANCAPSELQFIEPRLVSRFEWGIVLPLNVLDREGMIKVLYKKMEALHFPLHGKVADYLVETFSRNPKNLSKAFEALVLRSHLRQSSQSLSLPIVKQMLEDLIREELQAVITPEKIIQKTVECFGIRSEDILGKSQSREAVLPRQIAMYFCRHHLKMPFMKIGDLFSKDHSTVMSSVRVIQKGIDKNDVQVAEPYQTILKKIIS